MQEECVLGELRVRVPGDGFDGIGTGKRIVVVAIFDIRFGEYPHTAELARLTGAMPGREDDLRRDECTGTAKCRLPPAVHDDQHDSRMRVAIEVAMGDERRARDCR